MLRAIKRVITFFMKVISIGFQLLFNHNDVNFQKWFVSAFVFQTTLIDMHGKFHVIIKTMSPTGYHHDGFVATHAFGDLMSRCNFLVPMSQRVFNKPSKERNIICHNPLHTECSNLTETRWA